MNTDTSITSIQHYSYAPYTQSYDNQDEVRIVIQSQNACILPNDSYIYIEGKIEHAADPPTGFKSNIIANFPAFLFDSIRYELNGNEIDRCRNVGITSTMKCYASFKKSTSDGMQSAGWISDLPSQVCEFSLQIPLKIYMGFFEDYKQIIMNAKHEIILNRSRSDVNCFVGSHDNMKIKIDKILWRMPHIKFDDYTQVKMLKQIESNRSIPLIYRSWELYEYPALPQTNRHVRVWSVKTTSHLTRPRYILLAFQTNRNNNFSTSARVFDSIALTDVRV